MGFWWKMIKREFDKKPIACHLYVTDRCNLDCVYCTEYDNSVPHPPLEDLKRWIDKIKELGCIRIGLQGGEPLLHPDIVEIVRYCKSADLRTSMSTNGFLLSSELIAGLEDAGLDSMQISVDRMTPIPSTRKSLKTVIPKLELLKKSGLRFNLTGVLFKETLAESKAVLDYGLSEGISAHVRLIHAGPDKHYGADPGEKEALEAMIGLQVAEKKRGKKIHTNWHILRYQQALLNEESLDWTCVAGYKYFFVSAKGKFWLCSMNRHPNIDLTDVTPELLQSFFYKKECQTGCGVYCVVSESLANNHPFRFGMREALGHLRAKTAGTPG
ncbi:MAG: radical SAM protein [candidate division Zixibacteria bacterium]|nr:radical SAM protein [candidate division Zixibacteria bacterium]